MPIGEQPTVTRGRLTVLSKGYSRVFMFNPPEVSDDKSVAYGTLSMPGASHPVIQYGSGGERVISFQVYLDGDRGRYGREEQRVSISVEDHIRFYQSMLYPAELSMGDMKAVFPYLLLFNFGPLYRDVACVLKAAPLRVSYWSPHLEPVRATMGLALSEVPARTVTQADVFSLR